MEYILVVMFYLNGPANPPVFVEGFMPRLMESAEECEQHRAFADNQFQMMDIPPYHLGCYNRVPVGEPL